MITEATRAGIGGVFDVSGVTRGPDGIKRYDGLPATLVSMLREVCDRQPDAEAVAETGGVQRGDRTAIRLGNGVEWVLAFLGSVLAGAIVVPVNASARRPRAVSDHELGGPAING